MKISKPLVALATAALPLAFAAAPAQAAEDGTYTVPLNQLNDSGASGTAQLTLHGTSLHVVIDSHGLVPNSPHAEHIHGNTDGKNYTCPTDADVKKLDKNGDGNLTTTEAAPFYGPVLVSLTTKGDSSPKSAVAVKRFPVADSSGDLHYDRTLQLTQAQADNLTNLHVVQHGVDYNGDGKYDGDAKSDLNPDLPAEATDPAVCGALEPSQLSGTPSGGVDTGTGSTSGPESLPLVLVGGAALAGAAGVGVARRRSTSAAR